MSNKTVEIVYSSESELKSPFKLVTLMFNDLLMSRELAWRLLIRNISAMYRQTILGYLWAFLPPLFTMWIWIFLNSNKIINIDDPGMPYSVYVLTGTILWQTFVDALNSPLRIVNQSKAMLAKINFPHEALILTCFGEVIFNFAIRLILMIIIFIYYDISVSIVMLLGIFSTLSLIALGMMIGIFLTPLGILYTDIGRSITIVSGFWFFLTPVIYPMPGNGIAELLLQFNPVTPLLINTREWLVIGSTSQLSIFSIVSIISLILLFFSLIFYRISMPHLIARMSA